MEYRPLEITVISANDLKKVNLFSKMDPYVVVSISSDPTKHKTPAAKVGHRNPTWNFPVRFTVDEVTAQQGRLTLCFDIRCRGSLGVEKLIGDVRVPVKDLLAGAGSGEAAQFVSYQVRKPSGRPKGVLKFSFKLGEKFTRQQAPYAAAPPQHAAVYPPASAPYGKKTEEPVLAYPAVGPSAVYPPPSYAPPPVVHHGGAAEAYKYNGAYPPQQPAAAGYGYPAQQGYGYGYGYGQPPVVAPAQQRPSKNKFGMGLGAGLLGGALAGMLIGDVASDMAFDGGFDGGFDF